MKETIKVWRGAVPWRSYLIALTAWSALFGGAVWFFSASGPGAGAPSDLRLLATLVIAFVGFVLVIVFADSNSRRRGHDPVAQGGGPWSAKGKRRY